MKLHRREIYLPRVCRQINIESKPYVSAYTVVRMHYDASSDKAGKITFLLAHSKHHFSTVRILEISRAMAAKINREMMFIRVCRHYRSGRMNAQPHYTRAMAQTFQCLQIVVLPLEVKKDSDVEVYRTYFDKPDLEVKYNYNNPW